MLELNAKVAEQSEQVGRDSGVIEIGMSGRVHGREWQEPFVGVRVFSLRNAVHLLRRLSRSGPTNCNHSHCTALPDLDATLDAATATGRPSLSGGHPRPNCTKVKAYRK